MVDLKEPGIETPLLDKPGSDFFSFFSRREVLLSALWIGGPGKLKRTLTAYRIPVVQDRGAASLVPKKIPLQSSSSLKDLCYKEPSTLDPPLHLQELLYAITECA